MAQGSLPAEEPIGLLVAAVRSEVRGLLAARIEPYGLSVRSFWLLVGVADHCCHSQAELAAKLRIDEASASRAVTSLAGRGLVRATRDPVDRRRIQLQLTAAGERLAPALLPIAAEIRAAVESALTPQERAATRSGLVKILAALRRRSASAAGEVRSRPAAPTPKAPRRRAPLNKDTRSLP